MTQSWPARNGTTASPGPRAGARLEAGFTLIEILAAMVLLLFSFLALAGVFAVGYAAINGAGDTTVGLSAARLLLEDARRLPFDNLANLDGFNSDDPASLPAADPEREVAERWRYALAGDGVGWTFTSAEEDRWTTFSDQGAELDASGTIEVNAMSGTLRQITVRVSVPGTWRQVELSTVIASLP